MDSKSLDITAEKLAQLRDLFPEVFSEDKVDFARLKDILGGNVAFPNEHYELSWAGKAEARKEIQKQTTSTLIPDKQGSINFGETENMFIEGENLEVLRILQKSYFGRIKMIYIDPPYNTGNDSFVYPDDYAERLDEYDKRTGKTDEEGYLNKQDLWRKNTKENGQFHSVWLSMMYPRLYLARNLLSEDGVIFVSIDENESATLKLLLDEIFGEENFIEQLVWKSRQNKDNRTLTGVSVDHEYILCYSRSNEDKPFKGSERKTEQYSNPDNDPRGDWSSGNMVGLLPEHLRPNLHYDLINPKTGINYGKPRLGWRYDKKTMQKLIAEDRIIWPSDPAGRPRRKVFLKELSDSRAGFSSIVGEGIYTRDGTSEIAELFNERVFDFPKPSALLKEFVKQATQPADGDIILDFFSGSGSIAQAILELNEEDGGNRKLICVQMPEQLEETSEAYKSGYRTIADICRTRIQRVIAKLQTARERELPLEIKGLLGFDSFKIAPSNFKAWRDKVESDELLQQLEIFRQSEKDGSQTENMLYELLLKSGLPLTAKIETVEVGTQDAYIIENGKLLAFFETYDESMREFIREKSPKHVVCLDSVFDGKDEDLGNFKLGLSEAGIELTII